MLCLLYNYNHSNLNHTQRYNVGATLQSSIKFKFKFLNNESHSSVVAKAELHYRCLTPHFDFAFQRYISVFSLPPSTCLRLSVSLFAVPLLLPSSFFFLIHFNELNPTFLTHSSILYTCQSKALPITSLLNQWLYC